MWLISLRYNVFPVPTPQTASEFLVFVSLYRRLVTPPPHLSTLSDPKVRRICGCISG